MLVWKRVSYFGVPFLPHLPRSLFTPIYSFEKLFQDFCPFCILFIFVYISSTRILVWNFLIYYLGVRIPVPDKWIFLGSSLYDLANYNHFLNLHYFISLYAIFIIPPYSCKFLKYYVSNLTHVSWKICVNNFNPMAKIPLSYNVISGQEISFMSTNYIFLTIFFKFTIPYFVFTIFIVTQ